VRDGEYSSTHTRVRGALAGEPGEPCVGVTFLPAEAVGALVWGSTESDPIVIAVCSRLSPDFAFVESWRGDASAVCGAVAECGTVPFWVVRGPLDHAANARGWSETLAATVRDTGALVAQLDDGVEAARSSVRAAATCGAGAIVIADDVAGADGPLAAPDFILSELMPRLGAIARTAAEAGLPAIWHSDGDTRAFLGAVAREGFSGIHPGGLGPDPFRQLFSSARREGLVVLGGVPGWALRAGVPSALRAATSASLIARSGGLMICDDGGVSTGEELGALIAALQAVRDTA
jgi:outer membrane murein-binding lipoprotein Lpp